MSQARHASADWAPSDAYLVTVRDKARSPVLRECVNKPNNASLILSLPLPLLLSNIYTLKKKTKKQGGTDYLSTYTFLTFVSLWGGGGASSSGGGRVKRGCARARLRVPHPFLLLPGAHCAQWLTPTAVNGPSLTLANVTLNSFVHRVEEK